MEYSINKALYRQDSDGNKVARCTDDLDYSAISSLIKLIATLLFTIESTTVLDHLISSENSLFEVTTIEELIEEYHNKDPVNFNGKPFFRILVSVLELLAKQQKI